MKFSHPIPFISNKNHFVFSDDYSFGFQAQEQDEEMWGGSVTYKYRVEDPRLGRFFSVDPLSAKYPWNSNYAFSENRLIDAVELEGLEQVNYQEKRVDGVTVGLDIVATNDPTNSGAPVNTTSRTDYPDAGGGQVNPVGTPVGTSNGIGVRSQDIVNDVIASGNTADISALNTVTASGNLAPGSISSVWFDNPNQFNIARTETNAGGGVPAGQLQPAITTEITTPATTISPSNISRVLILTNGSAAANANAILEASALALIYTNIQFAVASDPVSIANVAGTPGLGANANSYMIIYNPTGEMAVGGVGFSFGSIPAANYLIPFVTPLLPSQPLSPLQDNTGRPIGLRRN